MPYGRQPRHVRETGHEVAVDQGITYYVSIKGES